MLTQRFRSSMTPVLVLLAPAAQTIYPRGHCWCATARFWRTARRFEVAYVIRSACLQLGQRAKLTPKDLIIDTECAICAAYPETADSDSRNRCSLRARNSISAS